MSKRQSTDLPDKWLLEIEIIEAQNVEGPNFARVGQRTKAFTFESSGMQLTIGGTFSALGEYLGGPTGGQFQLRQVRTS